MSRPDLLVVGDAVLDVVARSGPFAEEGDVRGLVTVRAGGQGANVAVWAASEGLAARLVSRVGDDPAGRVVREEIEARGVEVDLGVDPGRPTGTLLVHVEGGERSMVADRGAAGWLPVDGLPEALGARAVFVSGYLLFDETSEGAGIAALERARADHVAVEASSWPLLEAYGADRFLESTRPATILFANEREAEVLAGVEAAEAPRKLAERYETVCVKRGAEGAVLAAGDLLLATPARETGIADPTGAGDAFDAAFLAALLRGAALGRALDHANTTGAWVAGHGTAWP